MARKKPQLNAKKILLFLACISVLVGVFLRATTNTSAAWYNNSWLYRKALTITNNSASTQTDYVIEVNLDTKSLQDASKLQADCDDLVFTSSDGTTLQSHFIDYCSSTTSVNSSIFVKVDSIAAAGTTTIYMYYGNGSTSTMASAFTSVGYPSAVVLGTGKDGALSISADTNINTADSNGRACSDTTLGDAVIYTSTATTAANATSIVVATSPSAGCLTAGDEVLIINMRGNTTGSTNTDVGKYEFARVTTTSTTTINLNRGLTNAYDGSINKIVVQRVPNYLSVTTATAGTDLTPSAWDGATNYRGGILAFRSTGTVTVAASTTINANGLGFAGGTAGTLTEVGGNAGESYDGPSTGRGGNGASAGETRGGGKAGDGTVTSPNNGAVTGAGGGGGSAGSADNSTGGGAGGGGGGYNGGGSGGGSNSDDATPPGGTGGQGGSVSAGVAAGGGAGACADTAGAASSGDNGGSAGSAGTNSTCTQSSAAGGQAGSGSTQGSGGAGAANTTGTGAGGGGGGSYGTAALTTLFLGSGGGGGGAADDGTDGTDGKAGGGIVFIHANSVSVSGNIQSTGTNGVLATTHGGSGGSGAGGSVFIKTVTDSLGAGLVSAAGGNGSGSGTNIAGGGLGAFGRIHVSYTDSGAPTISAPSANTAQVPYISATGSEEDKPAPTDTPIPTAANAHPITPPVLGWRFDEGGGTTTGDSSTNLNTGTITNATWQMSSSSPDSNKRSVFLRFDGTGDYVSRAYDSDLDFGTGSFSVTGWFRHSPSISAQNTIVARASAVDSISYKVYLNSSGFVCFGTRDDASTFPEDSACTTVSFADAGWHHFAAVKTSTTSIAIFVDGKLHTTNSSTTADSTLTNASALLYVGIDGDASSNAFTGDIDQISIYNYALSAALVQSDVLDPSSALIGASPNDVFTNGLVGYWKLDDDLIDSSGNGSTLTNVASTTYTQGKFGNAANFESDSSQYMYVADNVPLSMTKEITMSAWIKPESVTGGTDFTIMAKWDGSNRSYSFIQNADRLQVTVFDGGTTSRITPAVLSVGTWYHVAAVSAPNRPAEIYVNGVLITTSDNGNGLNPTGITDSTARFHIGAYASQAGLTAPYDGIIDNVRVYNRAFSSKEVDQLYNWSAPPVGWWKMDESNWTNNCSTTSIIDSSASSFNARSCPNGTGPTSTTVGKYGRGAYMDGTDDRIESTTASVPSMQGTVSLWVYPRSSGTYDFFGAGVSNNDFRLSPGNNLYGFFNNVSGAGEYRISYSTDPAANTWTYLTITWDQTSGSKLFYNGVQVATNTTPPVAFSSTGIYMGTSPAGAEWFPGTIDDVKMYNYARTPKQIVEDMNANHPAGGSPISSQNIYYKMSEANGTTLNNSNPLLPTYTGTITGATWLAPSSCRIGTCLDFDGVDDESATANLDAVDTDTGLSGGFTWSAFVYVDSDGEGAVGRIFSKGTDTYLRVSGQTNGRVDLAASHDRATTDATVTVSSAFPISEWHHVAVSWNNDTDDQINIWIDGRKRGTSTNSSGAPGADSSTLIIGGDNSTTGNFDGRIDEVKVYNGELTPSEIQIDANAGSSASFGTMATQNNEGFSMPSPLLTWNLDEGSGTSAKDTSGTANTGTINNTPDWVQGKFGSGLKLNGSTQSITATITSLGSTNSISVWVYPTATATSKTLVTATKLITDSSARPTYGTCVGTALANNTWTHIVAVSNGAASCTIYQNGILTGTNTTGVTFSTSVNLGASSFAGVVDQLNMYSSALTGAQAAYLFNRGAPLAYFKFDDCQSTTIYNSAKNGNGDAAGSNGTFSIGSGGQLTAGNCSTSSTSWGNGAVGKYNAALDFDGTDDIVSFTSNFLPTADFTVSAWVKADTLATNTILESLNGSGGNEFKLDVTASAFRIQIGSGATIVSSNTTITTGVWYHVVARRSGSTINLFVNGQKQANTVSDSTALSFSSCMPYIGVDYDGACNTAPGGEFWDGLIDELKVYNYALTDTQVLTDYNQNSAARFGPVTGTP